MWARARKKGAHMTVTLTPATLPFTAAEVRRLAFIRWLVATGRLVGDTSPA